MPEIKGYNPQVSVPSKTGIRFGSSGAEKIGEALGGLGRSMEHMSKELKELEDRKQHALDSNEAFSILNQTEEGIETDLTALRRQGIPSQDYLRAAHEAIDNRRTLAEERIGGLVTDKVREYATGQLGNAVTRRRIGVIDESDRKFIDEDRGNTAARAQELVNRSINAPDDAGFALYRQQLKDLWGSKAGNTFTQQEAEREWSKGEKTIAVERLKAQIRAHPTRVEEVLSGAAGQDMPEHEKDAIRDYSDAVLRKKIEQENQVLEAATKVYRANAEHVEIEVQEAARLKQITKDQIAEIARRNRGPRGEPIFTAERVKSLQKMVDDAGKFESDPLTLQQLSIAVQNATTAPQLAALNRAIDVAYQTDRLNVADWNHLVGKTRTFSEHMRDEIKMTYKDAHDTVLKEIETLFRISPDLPLKQFDERAQAYHQTLRELNQVSVLRGGQLDPRVWWEDNRFRVAGRVKDILDKQFTLRANDVSPQLRPGWVTDDPSTITAAEVARAAARLEQARRSMPQDEYRRNMDALLELRAMVRQRLPIVEPPKKTNTLGRPN